MQKQSVGYVASKMSPFGESWKLFIIFFVTISKCSNMWDKISLLWYIEKFGLVPDQDNNGVLNT